jgi:hypothetical protein
LTNKEHQITQPQQLHNETVVLGSVLNPAQNENSKGKEVEVKRKRCFEPCFEPCADLLQQSDDGFQVSISKHQKKNSKEKNSN